MKDETINIIIVYKKNGDKLDKLIQNLKKDEDCLNIQIAKEKQFKEVGINDEQIHNEYFY